MKSEIPREMKAIVQHRYGPFEEVLELSRVPVPSPREDEVLVRVRAASVHPDIWHVVTASPHVLRLFGSGIFTPRKKIPGTDAAGEVVAVGARVTQFSVGDEVFGETHIGMQWLNGGSFAEYVSAPESALSLKPRELTFEQAATLPTAGIIALGNLPRGLSLGEESRVLVNGAAGGVGSIVVQVAKAAGAHVTAVDSGEKQALLRSWGADAFIDYTRQDIFAESARYDLIYDVASVLPYSICRRHLTEDGVYVIIGHDHYGRARGATWGSVPLVLGLAFRSLFDKHLPKPATFLPKQNYLRRLAELAEERKLVPRVFRSFPLDEAVSALELMRQGDVLGRIVVTP